MVSVVWLTRRRVGVEIRIVGETVLPSPGIFLYFVDLSWVYVKYLIDIWVGTTFVISLEECSFPCYLPTLVLPQFGRKILDPARIERTPMLPILSDSIVVFKPSATSWAVSNIRTLRCRLSCPTCLGNSSARISVAFQFLGSCFPLLLFFFFS